MTIKELFSYCVNELSFSDDSEFEAICIFNDLLGISKSTLYTTSAFADSSQINTVESVISKRKNGVPLQYILGEWDFYDLTFSVGEGVLIPRPETEQLVDFALEKLKNIENPVVYDLCAGTGCIGLTVAYHCPYAKVYLLEKEPLAFSYLKKNCDRLNLSNVIIINDDLFTADTSLLCDADIILSNPPYIPSSEIKDLQTEVLSEPVSALDGGSDGLMFYQCLSSKWIKKLNYGGFMAMECGDGQSGDIIEMFRGKSRENNVLFDFNDIDRIVIIGI